MAGGRGWRSVGTDAVGSGAAGRGEALRGDGRDVLLGEAELLVELLIVGRGTEVLQRDATAGVADDLVPPLGARGLDGHTGPHCGGQDLVAVRVVLRGEPLPARHRHDPGGNALAL